jgi:hypothetical protein
MPLAKKTSDPAPADSGPDVPKAGDQDEPMPARKEPKAKKSPKPAPAEALKGAPTAVSTETPIAAPIEAPIEAPTAAPIAAPETPAGSGPDERPSIPARPAARKEAPLLNLLFIGPEGPEGLDAPEESAPPEEMPKVPPAPVIPAPVSAPVPTPTPVPVPATDAPASSPTPEKPRPQNDEGDAMVLELIHALDDALHKVEDALARNDADAVSQAAGHMAEHAERFGLHVLTRMARGMQDMAAEADGLDAVADTMPDLRAAIERNRISFTSR